MLDVDAVSVLIALGVFTVFALVIVTFVHQWKSAQRRREEFALWAASHGLTYSAEGPHGLDQLDFKLFSRGDGRGWENVVSGRWDGLDVRVADYWYYEESHGEHGSSKTYYRFSVVLAAVEAWLPPVQIAKENVLTRLADHLAMRDLEFESDEFNRTFNVKASAREFAFKLLDARMLEWLLHTAGPHCYEVSGPWVLGYCKRLPAAEVPTLLFAVNGFIGHIPRLVWADYGKATS